MRNIEQELRQFVIDNFLFGQGNGNLRNDDSFLDKGIIDSTGVLELVVFLEEIASSFQTIWIPSTIW